MFMHAVSCLVIFVITIQNDSCVRYVFLYFTHKSLNVKLQLPTYGFELVVAVTGKINTNSKY